MKYSYIFEINKALSQAYKRNIQLSFPEYGVTEEDLAADIDCALEVWRKNVDQFRSDNSDRFTAQAPMPPEVRDLCFFLKECQGIARRRASQVTGDSDAWDDRACSLAFAVGVVTSYYPHEDDTTHKKTTIGKQTRPFDEYVLCNDVSGFKALLKSQLTNKNGSMKRGKEAAGVIGDAIRTKKLSKDVDVKGLVKEFGMNCSPQGINRYLVRE